MCIASVSINSVYTWYLVVTEFNFPEGTNFIASKVVNSFSVYMTFYASDPFADTQLGYLFRNVNPN